MNPKETVPVLVKLAPVLAAAGPPALIGVVIGLGLLWLLSDNKKDETPQAPPAPDLPPSTTQTEVLPTPVMPPETQVNVPLRKPASRRIAREDIAEALAYGARSVPRGEAVAALEARGFHKTAAYRALSANGRFAELIEIAPDGLIEWKG
jgi:hypothetical protein